MDATTVAVDLAKDVFQVALANRAGRILDRQRLTRRQFERFLDTLAEDTEVIMESCGTAHYWGRRDAGPGLGCGCCRCSTCGPYVRRNKTDRADTDALLEAARCGEIRPVPVKTVEQQTLQALHRVRTQWQTARVARINAMRGLLREHGHAIPVGARTVLRRVTAILEDARRRIARGASPHVGAGRRRSPGARGEDRRPRSPARADRRRASGGDAAANDSRRRRADGDRVGRRGRSHSCISTRTRIRQLAGVDPRESSTGGAALSWVGSASVAMSTCAVCWPMALGPSCGRLQLRSARPIDSRDSNSGPSTTATHRGRNKATIAVANKLARIVWAVWRHDETFQRGPR